MSTSSACPAPIRVVSIDALRGFVMAMMIFVNDLAGARNVVPDWMVHYSDRHPRGSGMTFVDLVFPAFLFIVGLSIPFALGSGLAKPGGLARTLRHILARTAALLFIGLLMVNLEFEVVKLSFAQAAWSALLFASAILAFCDFSPPTGAPAPSSSRRLAVRAVRTLGFAGLAIVAFSFPGANGRHIVTLSPFALHHSWWGILGLIGWAYLVGAIVFVIFRAHRTALLGCMVLLMCLYVADQNGLFKNLWLAQHIGFGGSLGSQASIAVAGVLLATILLAGSDVATLRDRVRFTLLFAAGCAATAILVHGLYGIWKNDATPSWCLWACAITALLWLALYLISDVWRIEAIGRPLALAGKNVLLAYLLSEMLPAILALLHLDTFYAALASTLPGAIARSVACALVILAASVGLNRAGFRLKL